MIYELRVYEIAPGKMALQNKRFAEGACPLFEKHGMTIVGFWETVIGENNNELTYMLGYKDLADRERAWRELNADPEHHKLVEERQRDPEPMVRRIRNCLLRPTSYSPLR